MVTLIPREEIEKRPEDNSKSHTVGMLDKNMFTHIDNLKLRKNMKMDIAIIWLGHYKIDNRIFPRKKCPICGKEETLIPYHTIGSILSGCHATFFYCSHCKKQFVTNDDIEYFRIIYNYVLKQREAKKLKSLGGMSYSSSNIKSSLTGNKK